VVGLVAVVMVAAMAALLLPYPVAGDERDELDTTRRRLGAVESVLRDAKADAGAVAAALAAADQAVAGARRRLVVATGQLAAARRRRADAMVALEAATDEVGRQEARLAEQVRGAYMTGRVTGLAVMVQANDLRDLVERAVTLSYVISADQDVLSRLEVARKRAVQLHDGMVKAEKAPGRGRGHGAGPARGAGAGPGGAPAGQAEDGRPGGQAGRGRGRPAEPVGRVAPPHPAGGAGQAAGRPRGRRRVDPRVGAAL